MPDEKESEGGNLAKEIDNAIADTAVLLEYLGRLPDGRLQSQFDDANAKSPFPKLPIKAPCDSYCTFLNELCALWLEYRTNNRSISDATITPVKLSKLAFLFWSRDFLAGLAGPATSNSVQFTDKYVRWRFTGGEEDQVAKKNDIDGVLPLVKTVKRLLLRSVIVLATAIALSVYALSGQKILAARDSAITALKDVDEKIAIIEGHSQLALVNPTLRTYLKQVQEQNITNSDSKPEAPVESVPVSAGTPKGALVVDLAVSKKDTTTTQGVFFLCDNVDITNKKVVPSFGPVPTQSYYYYGSAEQIEICKQRRRTLTQLFAIGEELISWQRIATNPLQIVFPLSVRVPEYNDTKLSTNDNYASQGYAQPAHMAAQIVDQRSDFDSLAPIGQALEEFVSAPAGIFGKTDAIPREFANNQKICDSFVGSGEGCWTRLSEISEYYGTIPENILSCVTLYILPCLYGFLGAAVAILKYMRVQVDNHWLSFTDRGRIIQTQIMGVVMGSIVGLFAAYFTNSNQSFGALSVSAIAFLAGYNLSSLLTLFDDLSGRLFQKAPAASK